MKLKHPIYAFWGFKKFMNEFRKARILLLIGHKGTGKTLFSVALGYHLLRLSYVINGAFNFPVRFGGVPTYNQTYGVMDEAGVFFDARFAYKNKEASAFVSEATTFLRKRGSYLVIPSYNPPDKRLRNGLRMYRFMARGRFWFYRWELGPEEIEERIPKVNYFEGAFCFFNPHAFFNTYDTFYEPPLSTTLRWLKGFLETPLEIPEYVKF